MSTESLKRSNQENLLVKETAAAHIGRGFILDAKTGRYKRQGRISDEVELSNIDILNSLFHCKAMIITSEEQMRDSFRHEFGLNLDIKFPTLFQTGCSSKGQKKRSDLKNHKNIYLFFVCIKIHECALKTTLRVRKDFNYQTFDRNVEIGSAGKVFLAFYTTIRISAENQLKEKKSDADISILASENVNQIIDINAEGSLDSLKSMVKVEKFTLENVTSIGNYKPPKKNGTYTTIASLQRRLNSIRDHFENHHYLCGGRKFVLTDTIRLSDLLPALPDSLVEPQTCTTDKPSNEQPKQQINLFLKFQNEMIDYKEPTIIRLLNNLKTQELSIEMMLQAMEEAFKTLLTPPKYPLRSDQSMIIYGETSAGKSLLTGYLLGATCQSVLKSSTSRKRIITFQNGHQTLEDLPQLGHTNSKTKGCQVYGNYLDAAGIGDSSGRAAEICNRIAIQCALNKEKPGHVIIVMDTHLLTSRRGLGFLELLDQFESTFGCALESEMFENVLFVVNQKDGKLEHSNDSIEEIKSNFNDGLNDLKKVLLDELEKTGINLQDKKSLFNTLLKIKKPLSLDQSFSKNEIESIQDQLTRQLKPDDPNYDKIMKKIRHFHAIQQIISNNAIVVASFGDERTKTDIEEWQRTKINENKSISSTKFGAWNPDQSAYTIFIDTLKAVALYFTRMKERKVEKTKEITELDAEIRKNNEKIKKIEDQQWTEDDTLKECAELKKKKTTIINEIADYENEIKTLQNKITTLEENKELVIVQNQITPRQPIYMRQIWHLWKIPPFGPTYKFDLREAAGKFPIKKITQVSGPRGAFYIEGEKTGIAIDWKINAFKKRIAAEINKQNESERVLNDDESASLKTKQIVFIPAWFGYEQDQHSYINLWTEKCSAPKTKDDIELKTEMIKKKEADIKQKEETLRRVETQLNNALHVTKEGLKKVNTALKKEKDKKESALKKLNEKFDKYNQAFDLTRKIVEFFMNEEMYNIQNESILVQFRAVCCS